MSIRAPLRSRHKTNTVTLNTSLTRPTTRCHFQHPAKPFRLKHPASLNTTSLAAPRTNLLKAANKNFRCCVLLKKSLVIHFVCPKYSVIPQNRYNSYHYLWQQTSGCLSIQKWVTTGTIAPLYSFPWSSGQCLLMWPIWPHRKQIMSGLGSLQSLIRWGL